jgi:hypothetical protein
MRGRTAWLRASLFLALVFVWPLPLVGLAGSLVPVARFAQLAASLTVFVAIEGLGGMAGTMLILLWSHVLVYGLMLYGVAWLIASQVLARLPERVAIGATLVAVLALVGWGTLAPPYDTLFHHSDAHASLAALYR